MYKCISVYMSMYISMYMCRDKLFEGHFMLISESNMNANGSTGIMGYRVVVGCKRISYPQKSV